MPLTFEALRELGADLGHGSLIALDERVDRAALRAPFLGLCRRARAAEPAPPAGSVPDAASSAPKVAVTPSRDRIRRDARGDGARQPVRVRAQRRAGRSQHRARLRCGADEGEGRRHVGRRFRRAPVCLTLLGRQERMFLRCAPTRASPRTAPVAPAWSRSMGRTGQSPPAPRPPPKGHVVRTDDPVALDDRAPRARADRRPAPRERARPAAGAQRARPRLPEARRRAQPRFAASVPPSRDDSHPYVKYDATLCIACARCVRMCDEVQGTFALAMVGRGADTVVAPGSGGPWSESGCVGLRRLRRQLPDRGAVGGRVARPAADRAHDDDHLRLLRGRLHARRPHPRRRSGGDHARTARRPVNRGHACVKGRFAHGFVRSPDRLTTPLIRRDGALARGRLGRGARAMSRPSCAASATATGPTRSPRSPRRAGTNEENYLMQKLMRVAIGTNNVDNCSRICHAPSAAGLVASFGLSGGTNPFDDFDRAGRASCSAGSNPTEAHPVVGARIKQRVIAGARPGRRRPAPHRARRLRRRPPAAAPGHQRRRLQRARRRADRRGLCRRASSSTTRADGIRGAARAARRLLAGAGGARSPGSRARTCVARRLSTAGREHRAIV